MYLHVRRECVEGLVEEVHLYKDAADDDKTKHVGARMCELVLARNGQLDGDTEALDSHDGHGAKDGADGDIDKRVCAPVPGGNNVYQCHADGDGRKCI
jgi:hypothetical protein